MLGTGPPLKKINTEVPYSNVSSKEKYLIPYRMLSKNSRWHFAIFSYFPSKMGFDISCKLSPKETPIFWTQYENYQKNMKNINVSSAAFAQKTLYEYAWLL